MNFGIRIIQWFKEKYTQLKEVVMKIIALITLLFDIMFNNDNSEEVAMKELQYSDEDGNIQSLWDQFAVNENEYKKEEEVEKKVDMLLNEKCKVKIKKTLTHTEVIVNTNFDTLPRMARHIIESVAEYGILASGNDRTTIAKVHTPIGQISVTTEKGAAWLMENSTKYHAINPHVWMNKKSVRKITLYSADYTNNKAIVTLKSTKHLTDIMFETVVITTITAMMRTRKGKMKLETTGIVLLVPYVKETIYMGGICMVKNMVFVVIELYLIEDMDICVILASSLAQYQNKMYLKLYKGEKVTYK